MGLPTPEADVVEFVRDYDGDNEFMLSLQDWVLSGRRLTPRQLEAAVRNMDRLAEDAGEERRLWRAIVKAAHPDLATDAGDQAWRRRLTVFANTAYDEHDRLALGWLYALVVET